MTIRHRTRYILSGSSNRGGLAQGRYSPVLATSSLSGDKAPLWLSAPSYYSPMHVETNGINFFDDEDPKLTPAYSRKDPHYADHYNIEPACISGEDFHDYTNYGLPMCHAGGGFMCWYDPGYSAPSYQWTPVYESLASQLADRNRDSSLMLVTLKELRETIEMVRNPFCLLKDAGTRKLKSRISLLKGLSSGLLEYTFGWKSLHSDVTQIAKTCANLYDPGGLLGSLEELAQRYSASQTQQLGSFQVASGGRTPAQYDALDPTLVGSDGTAMLCTGSATFTNRAGGYLVMDLHERIKRSQDLFRFTNQLGLTGWRSFRDFLWEIVPYSFVIDWFVDTRGIWAPVAYHEVLKADLKRTCYSTLYEWNFSVKAKVNTLRWARNDATSPWYLKYPSSSTKSEWGGTIGHGKRYTRHAGLPSYSEAALKFNTSGLSLMQYALSGALVTQRLRF